MALQAIAGGFNLSATDEKLKLEQRAITYQVNENFIPVGAVLLKVSDKAPYEKDWQVRGFRDTKLQSWIDDPEQSTLNVGFNLQQGWVDIDIDSSVPDYNRCIIAGMKFVGVDTRFRFGRLSAGCPSHILVQLVAEEAENYSQLKQFEPNEFRYRGLRHKVELRSTPVNVSRANLMNEAKQTVMPGSIYADKTDPNRSDLSVWYDAEMRPARAISQIASTTARPVPFNALIRGIAFGTALYLMKPEWVEGSRQMTATKVSGWLARVVKDSQGINNHDVLADDVFCPIDSDDYAEGLLKFICEELGDDEPGMRVRTYHDARQKITRNPDAKIPGWPTMANLFGEEAVNALRAVLMPGADVSKLTKFSERYIFDEQDNKFIDRQMFNSSNVYAYKSGDLADRHKNDELSIGGKKRSAWKVFEGSELRKHVSGRDLYPNEPRGTVFRVNRVGMRVDDDDPEDYARMVFNTWKGWTVQAAQPADPELLKQCNSMLDRLLGYLTQGNERQMEWLKWWLAWTIQFPGTKQQIAPVIIGAQGVGKSFFGNTFLKAIFHPMFGTASPKILAGDFAIEPFVDKMVVFIDEARFQNEASADEVKKIVRNVEVSGAEKYQSARTHRIFARMIFASNHLNMNLGQANVRDRALFYIKTTTKEHMRLTEDQWQQWVIEQKPFFDEFNAFLERPEVCSHYMHIFATMPVDKHKIESTEHSSAADSEIVAANMSQARQLAKYIIEDGRVLEDSDISMPFSTADINKTVLDACLAQNIKLTNHGQKVLREYLEAGVVEQYKENGRNLWRFKYKLATLTEKFGLAISVPLEPRFEFTEEDYGENDTTLATPKSWKGLNRRVFGKL